MPRSIPPTQNPYAHGSAALGPYARRAQFTMSPSSSDKENTTPPTPEQQSQQTRLFASQAAFRALLGDQKYTQLYDPHQDKNTVREVRRGYRRLLNNINERTKEYLMPGNDGIRDTQEEANVLYEDVRSTALATLDSSLIVRTSDLAKRKAHSMTFGDAGMNIDEYVSKLVTRMGGGHLFRGRELIQKDRSREMEWSRIGRLAKGIARRPPTVGFMLGPLSVEKKERRIAQRQAKGNGTTDIVRPQQLKEEDIKRWESDTTKMVRLVYNILREYAPINLFEFVINPFSFSQTIENIFYLSFSVQDARAKIEIIGDRFPVVNCVDNLTEDELIMENSQFVFEMTMDNWKELIESLDIRDCIIPHRREVREERRGWY